MDTVESIPRHAGLEASASQTRWTGRTRGGYFGNWFFVQLIRWLGVWPAYFWVTFVAAYFTVAHASDSRASADYLGRVLGPVPWWRLPLLVYRHFLARGLTLVDRVALQMGRIQIECVFEGRELLASQLQEGRGVILLGAHLGCWEMGGHFLENFGTPVNLVVISRELPNIQRLLDSVTAGNRFRILTADDDPLRSIPILAALRRGEIVALLGDRSFGGADVEATFLGGKVRLPAGPYRLAAASGAPVFQVFVVRERLGHYRFAALPPYWVTREEIRADPDAVKSRAEQYAESLEIWARRYPFQWANFFPYWEQPPASRTTAAAMPHST